MALKFPNLLAMFRKPYFQEVPVYPAAETLDWIPNGKSQIFVYSPAETPNGVVTQFTFTKAPIYLYYNGQVLLEGAGYHLVSALVAELLDSGGLAFAPETGAYIRAIA